MADQNYISALRRVIAEVHQCHSIHLESVRVQEVFGDVIVWTGEIEVFGVDHPRARRCFAWIRDRDYDRLNAPARVFAILQSTIAYNAEEAAKFARIGERAELVVQFSLWGVPKQG